MKKLKDRALEFLSTISDASRPASELWKHKVDVLADLCRQGSSHTHIAFIGTILLAKAVDLTVDVFCIKPRHADSNPNAFSARTLCHNVLVPYATKHDIDLGVTGREPLNNNPYFRMTKFGDYTPVHSRSLKAYENVQTLVLEIDSITDPLEAEDAFRGFVAARRRSKDSERLVPAAAFTVRDIAASAKYLCAVATDGGRSAQALVAGLLEAAFGTVKVKRVNDPSRRFPGDVCFDVVHRSIDPHRSCYVEVRDKAVSTSDMSIFLKKCSESKAAKAMLFTTSLDDSKGVKFDIHGALRDFGLVAMLVRGWDELLVNVMMWNARTITEFEHDFPLAVYRHMKLIGATPEALGVWRGLALSLEAVAAEDGLRTRS